MNNPNYYFRCRKNKMLLRSVKKDDCKNWLIKFPYEWQINDCFWWVYNLSKKLNITHEEYNKIFPKLLLRGRILYWMNHEEFLKISLKFGLNFFEDLQLIISSFYSEQYFKNITPLWQFLLDMLNSDKFNPEYITWVDKNEGIFQMIKNEEIAEMWGKLVNIPTMTYAKLSKRIRYRYHTKYFVKMPGVQKANVFQFGEKLTHIFNGKSLLAEFSPLNGII